MARDESEREDLLAEATALVERVELSIPGYAEPVVAGFRRDGCASVYLGDDPAYHFNTAGQLRRAFVAGKLWKAASGKLVLLARRRTAEQTELVQHWPSADEQAALLADVARRLATLRQNLVDGQYTVGRQVPAEGAVDRRLVQWLHTLPLDCRTVPVAASPHAR